MGVGADVACPLPDDPSLAQVVAATEATGQIAWIVDATWKFAYASEDARSIWTDRDGGRLGSVAIGHHIFSTESLRVALNWRFGLNTVELWRALFRSLGGMVLADTEGGPDELRSQIDPAFHDLVDEVVPCDDVARGLRISASSLPGAGTAPTDGSSDRGIVESDMLVTRIRSPDGVLRGTSLTGKPTARMSALGAMAWLRDLDHLQRMDRFTRAGRHPMAILFADLERSTALLRRLRTADYFTLGRRLVRAADRCVVDAGGIVGRHLGDGVVAFFPAVTSGSESEAARACIVAARAMRDSLAALAAPAHLSPETLVVRFGLHWGDDVFIGQISTIARSEVTALGTAVNATARIEASASGGRILASERLIGRLEPEHATVLGIEPGTLRFTTVGDLDTATEKARRDAATIAVCEL